MTTIVVSSDIVVGAGETLVFANETAFIYQASTNLPDPTLTISGRVEVTSNLANDWIEGIRVGGGSLFANSFLRIAPTGVLIVKGTGQRVTASGFESGGWTPATIINEGLIEVTATGTGWAIRGSGGGGGQPPLRIDNRGTIRVTGADGAWGVVQGGWSEFTNSGLIDVTSTGARAYAVSAGGFSFVFNNSGTIIARSSDPVSAAVTSGVSTIFNAPIDYTNSGHIEGPMAMDLGFARDQVWNTGTMKGIVSLGANADTFINRGAIDGRVEMGDGNDYFDGYFGSAPLALGGLGDDTLQGGTAGSDRLYGDLAANTGFSGQDGRDQLWGQGGGDFLYGEGGDDQLHGQAGDDVLEGGAGQDELMGEDDLSFGVDTAVYASAPAAVTVSLINGAFQETGGAGRDKLFSIENLTGSAFADTLTGSDIANHLIGAAGDDRLEGRAGDDLLDGGAGSDWASYASAGAGVTVRLTLQGQAQNLGAAGSDTLVSIENLIGGAFADSLFGDGQANRLQGGGGSDQLDGGAGLDAAVYAASSADFDWWELADGSWRVKDLRAAQPEGSDRLVAIEQLVFSDRALTIVGPSAAETVRYAFENVLRKAPTGTDEVFANGLAAALLLGQKTQAAVLAEIVARADHTTAVAVMSYQFFLGFTPSKGGLDYLISPTGPNANNINSAYYQAFNVENRYINFAVNLGKLGEGAPGFLADYGARSLAEATKAAYGEIFGAAPSDAKVAAILDAQVGAGMTRAQYFAIYGGDGLTGIGTKAAMVGWLLTEAAKADIGMYAQSSNAFLTDLADGAETLIDLIGLYGRPEWTFGG